MTQRQPSSGNTRSRSLAPVVAERADASARRAGSRFPRTSRPGSRLPSVDRGQRGGGSSARWRSSNTRVSVKSARGFVRRNCMRHRRLLVAIGSLATLLALLLSLGMVGEMPHAGPGRTTDATSSSATTGSAIPAGVVDDAAGARAEVSPSPALELRCRVCRGMSAPFAGAAVLVEVAGPQGSTQTGRMIADGQGVARITLIDRGATTATFTSDRDDVWGKPAVLVLQPDRPPPVAILRLYPLDAQVQGVVTDLQDRPLPGARVSWMRDLPGQPCDADGCSPCACPRRWTTCAACSSRPATAARREPGARSRCQHCAPMARPLPGPRSATRSRACSGKHTKRPAPTRTVGPCSTS